MRPPHVAIHLFAVVALAGTTLTGNVLTGRALAASGPAATSRADGLEPLSASADLLSQKDAARPGFRVAPAESRPAPRRLAQASPVQGAPAPAAAGTGEASRMEAAPQASPQPKGGVGLSPLTFRSGGAFGGDLSSNHLAPPAAYAPYQVIPPAITGDLDADAMVESLHARGFSDVGAVQLRGRTYICEATGPRRERVRLVVDAESGAISGIEFIGYGKKPK